MDAVIRWICLNTCFHLRMHIFVLWAWSLYSQAAKDLFDPANFFSIKYHSALSKPSLMGSMMPHCSRHVAAHQQCAHRHKGHTRPCYPLGPASGHRRTCLGGTSRGQPCWMWHCNPRGWFGKSDWNQNRSCLKIFGSISTHGLGGHTGYLQSLPKKTGCRNRANTLKSHAFLLQLTSTEPAFLCL